MRIRPLATEHKLSRRLFEQLAKTLKSSKVDDKNLLERIFGD